MTENGLINKNNDDNDSNIIMIGSNIEATSTPKQTKKKKFKFESNVNPINIESRNTNRERSRLSPTLSSSIFMKQTPDLGTNKMDVESEEIEQVQPPSFRYNDSMIRYNHDRNLEKHPLLMMKPKTSPQYQVHKASYDSSFSGCFDHNNHDKLRDHYSDHKNCNHQKYKVNDNSIYSIPKFSNNALAATPSRPIPFSSIDSGNTNNMNKLNICSEVCSNVNKVINAFPLNHITNTI